MAAAEELEPVGPLEILAYLKKMGACRAMGPDIFYPAHGAYAEPGRKVCRTCPVMFTCREYGVAHETKGTWGGLSERELMLERRRRRIGPVTSESE